MRLPYQILVFPFLKDEEGYHYAIFKRKDLKVWQGIAGGGEEGEKPIDTAKRETFEEAEIRKESNYVPLSSLSTTSATKICGLKWGKDIVMIPEFAFGVEVSKSDLKVGEEHTEIRWCSIDEALDKLEWDSNKQALWELDYRLRNNTFKGVKENKNIIRELL